VYEAGSVLGGKAASRRGPAGRIEEHGLHVWLGYYDNAFRLMRECYDELDRPRLDRRCPVKAFSDAFTPSGRIGVADPDANGWSYWTALLSPNDRVPGGDDASGLSPDLVVERLLDAVGELFGSVQTRRPRPGLVLSSSPLPPTRRLDATRRDAMAVIGRDLDLVTHAGMATLLAEFRTLPVSSIDTVLTPAVDALDAYVRERLAADRDTRRLAEVLRLVLTMMRGIAADGLLDGRRTFRDLDGESLTDWLRRHGLGDLVDRSALVRGLHDLVFGYDPIDGRSLFPAGLGLQLAARLFFDYKGAVFWKMQAGMGDVVIVPLFQALHARGVEFRIGHRIDALRLGRSGQTVDAIELTRMSHGESALVPTLIRVGGLPCFGRKEVTRATPSAGVLRRGRDFDWVVLGISVGGLRPLCRDLERRHGRWRDMLKGMRTVATQSFQVWLDSSEIELGWPHGDTIVAGGSKPFDTYAPMSHLIEREDWQGDRRPKSLAYFCSILPDVRNGAFDNVRLAAMQYLEQRSPMHWPRAHGSSGFDWSLLVSPYSTTMGHPFDDQFWVANDRGSDRYVQATPASDALRIAPGNSGCRNLVLAGDWTDSGLNAGCIESAVLSGLEAANAVLGQSRATRILGGWLEPS
jgi:uncharacterized protein with NAD-binding domain and iron-sulfur cluster